MSRELPSRRNRIARAFFEIFFVATARSTSLPPSSSLLLFSFCFFLYTYIAVCDNDCEIARDNAVFLLGTLYSFGIRSRARTIIFLQSSFMNSSFFMNALIAFVHSSEANF
jgi:hypothetical protein